MVTSSCEAKNEGVLKLSKKVKIDRKKCVYVHVFERFNSIVSNNRVGQDSVFMGSCKHKNRILLKSDQKGAVYSCFCLYSYAYL